MAKLSKLESIAGEVAISAPLKQNRYVSEARIPWVIVNALREELDRRGVDWRSAKIDYDGRVREDQRKALAPEEER